SFKVKVNDLSFSVHVVKEIFGESLYFPGEDHRPDRGRKDSDHSIPLCVTEETISTKPSFLEKQNKVDYSDDRRFGNPISGDGAGKERSMPTPSTALKSQDKGIVVRVGGAVSVKENHRGVGCAVTKRENGRREERTFEKNKDEVASDFSKRASDRPNAIMVSRERNGKLQVPSTGCMNSFNTVDINDATLKIGPGPMQHEEEEVEAQSSSGPVGEGRCPFGLEGSRTTKTLDFSNSYIKELLVEMKVGWFAIAAAKALSIILVAILMLTLLKC
ncbi:hypothetical protein Ancab_038850, partial [Ancistrocladus abbreviatus]